MNRILKILKHALVWSWILTLTSVSSAQILDSNDFVVPKVGREFGAPQPFEHEVAKSDSIHVDLQTIQANHLAEPPTTPRPDVNTRPGSGLEKLWQANLSQIDWKKMIASLAIVIGGYLGLVMLSRVIHPGSKSKSSSQVMEIVSQTRLNQDQSLQLVRLGGKLILLLLNPSGAQAVGEVSDPDEVEQLLAQPTKSSRRHTRPVKLASQAKTPSRDDLGPLMEQLIKTMQSSVTQGNHKGTEYEA